MITVITGQDGSYLAEFLLDKGYEVSGIVRRVALEIPHHRLYRIEHIKDKLKLYPGSIESYPRLIEIFEDIEPDECYHLAAQSFVHESFDDGFSTFKTNVNGTHYILSTLRRKSPNTKFYFAGSSEMFGKAEETPQTERTRFHPRSPYGISKVTGFELTRNYRESYNIFACSGMLFNHESKRRGFEFVSRKITSGVARLKRGLENLLMLGNLDAKRDWGFAGDYVKAMWLMLQNNNPEDYVVATGKNHSIKELINLAFDFANLSYELVDLHSLSNKDADKEVTKLKNDTNKLYVIQHPQFYRPAEVNELLGDASKIKSDLGWEPELSFEDLVKSMVENDIREPGDKL